MRETGIRNYTEFTMAAMSGVSVEDNIKTEFEIMKLKKPYRYMLMKMTDDLKKIGIEKCGPKSETYADFVAQLPPDSCRYAIVDYTAVTISKNSDGTETKTDKDVLVFVVWCPDTSKVKEKMLYASSKEAVKGVCQGVAAEIQANDFDGISEEEINQKVIKK